MKNRHLTPDPSPLRRGEKSVGKGHGWIRRGMEQALGNAMELYWLFVCGFICARITAGKQNGMIAWIVQWSD
jgi:hypothetical protein